MQNPGHNMTAGTRRFRHGVISAILVGVSVTSHTSRWHLPRVIHDRVISVILAGVRDRPHRKRAAAAGSDLCPRWEGV